MGKVEYTKASIADHDDLLDFANYVFKIDFLGLLPKLYKPEYHTALNHYIVKEDGKIKAAVGSFPMEMKVCGKSLNVRGIGTVSVHPYTRRKGYMKALMNQAMEDMKKDKVDLACLGGNRQRYAYFSFEPCGPELEFHVASMNIQHVYGNDKKTNISFKKVEAHDKELLSSMKAVHDAQPNYVLRKEDFYDVLNSWYHAPYAVYEEGKFIGYMTVDSGFNHVYEWVMKDQSATEKVVREIFNSYKPGHVIFHCAPWQQTLIGYLESIAESHVVKHNQNFTVLNYVNVLGAVMELKASYTRLADGELTLCVTDVQRLKISVKDGKPTVEEYEGECEVELPHLKAMRFLFSPAASFYDFGVQLSPQILSWFPLPLFYPKQDTV